ncbi:hypothetical protein SteCoe_13842 [Stentor coeruleus]|uniref:Uncharacterized protein n=1 Tax=Stentor coeruleus TaxID=5963 RepID=A0A1R2C7F1_9CILI|nr:hypothetical protein SteCoe_13842 [Stentor coeruleus]
MHTKQKKESSSLESSPSKIWLSLPKTTEEINKTRNVKLMQSISFKEHHETESIESGLNIFKTLSDLSQKHEIYLNIPETIIMGYGFSLPALLYTNDKGVLKLQKDINNAHLRIMLDLFEKYRTRNEKKYIGPLAIKRDPNSIYNRILMKQSEIVLEWKDSYKVNAIIQRFVLSKGMKSSKLRISMGNDLKIYKIVSKFRQDLKNDVVSEHKNLKKVNIKQNYSRNVFNEIAQAHRASFLIKSSDIMNVFSKFDSCEISKSKDQPSMLLAPKRNNDCYSRQSTAKFASHKNIIPSREPSTRKIVILNIVDFFESCKGEIPIKTIEELKKDLKNCKFEDHDFSINIEEMRYTNYYRHKINKIFNVSTRNSAKTDIFEIKSTKGISKSIEMMQELKRIINGFCLKDRKLTKLVCDFIEDEMQNLYFIKIASAEYLNTEAHRVIPANTTESFICPGKYCDLEAKKYNLNKIYKSQKYTVLKKVILDHIKGTDNNPIELLNPRLYEKVRVCKKCFEIYMQKIVGVKKSASGIQLKRFNKKEAEKIMNDINPSTANETVKSMSKFSLSQGRTASTKFTDNHLTPLNKSAFASIFREKKGIIRGLFNIKKVLR